MSSPFCSCLSVSLSGVSSDRVISARILALLSIHSFPNLFLPVVLLLWHFFYLNVVPQAQCITPIASTSSFSPVFSRKVSTRGIQDLISTRISMNLSRSSFHLSSSTIFFYAALQALGSGVFLMNCCTSWFFAFLALLCW